MNISDFFFQIVLALLGVAVGVVAPLLRKKNQKFVATIASVLFIASASAWAGYEIGNRGAVASRIPDTKAKITSHRAGGEIDQNIDAIEGTFEKLSEDQKLWLYVIAGDRYFLHRVTTFSNGIWKVNDVTVGADSESGQEFEIGILVVDIKTDLLLSKNPDGIYYLPSGAMILDEISVIRK